MQKASTLVIAIPLAILLVGLAAPAHAANKPDGAGAKRQIFPVIPPLFSEGIFPCSDCHAGMEVNRNRRQLAEHTDIVLSHGQGQRWCLDCHNPDHRDTLRLVSGEVIPFPESYRLCGQCHVEKLRDWQVGIHGKRTGDWNGDKQYLLCAACHDPHHPKFKPLKPLPPPQLPGKGRK